MTILYSISTEVKRQDMFITTRTGTKRCIETTIEVEVLVQWKIGSTIWVTIKDMKNSYHVQMDGYVVQRHIVGNPALACWIRHVLVNHNRIIGNLKSKYSVRKHKFGIKIPKSVQAAKAFEEENVNTL